jgi:hypothetical protein
MRALFETRALMASFFFSRLEWVFRTGSGTRKEEMSGLKKSKPESVHTDHEHRELTLEQIEQINELLLSLGEYGEIHLIVQRGTLKYINRVESHKAWTEDEQR